MNFIHKSLHEAMSTWWEIRIAAQEPAYAAQAAQAAFAITDQLERLLSRFRADSEIAMIGALQKGDRLRLSEPVFECLRLAQEIEGSTFGAFNVGILRPEGKLPCWRLHQQSFEFEALSAPCMLDLGAIGKGFALDRMAMELGDWGVESFLLLGSTSSILAGEAPPGDEGWPVRIGTSQRMLRHRAVGTSGAAMRGQHILDPATGAPSCRYERTWALSKSAARADAYSTAWMNMSWEQIAQLCMSRPDLEALVLDQQQTLWSRAFPPG